MCEPIRPAPPVIRIRLSFMAAPNLPLLTGIAIFAPTDELGRHTGDDREGFDVGDDHRSGADDRALADRHTRQDRGIGADVCPCADAHRLDLEIRADDGHIDRQAVWLDPRILAPGPQPTHSSMIRSRASSRPAGRSRLLSPITACAIVAALNVGLGADEDAAADLEGFGMLEAYAAADLQPRAALARASLPDRLAHEGIDKAITGGENGRRARSGRRPIGLFEFLANSRADSPDRMDFRRPCTDLTSRRHGVTSADIGVLLHGCHDLFDLAHRQLRIDRNDSTSRRRPRRPGNRQSCSRDPHALFEDEPGWGNAGRYWMPFGARSDCWS
jgi:hypothetical protein